MLDANPAEHLDRLGQAPVMVAVTDGRETRHAVQLGVQMAQLLDADLVIGAVAVEPAHPVQLLAATALESGPLSPSERHELLRAQARMLALGTPEDLRTTVDVIASPSPGLGLSHLAARHTPSVIVLGASHRGPLEALRSADPTPDLLRHTSCPVLVTPPEHHRSAIERPRTVGIAWDLSLEADAALGAGLDLAVRDQAPVRIIHVLQPEAPMFMPPADPPLGRELETIRREEATSALTRALAEHPHPASVEVQLLDGAVVHELTAATEDLGLLVVGSRRVGPVLRLLAGSVSAHLAASSRCPVLIVPSGTALSVPAAHPASGLAQ